MCSIGVASRVWVCRWERQQAHGIAHWCRQVEWHRGDGERSQWQKLAVCEWMLCLRLRYDCMDGYGGILSGWVYGDTGAVYGQACLRKIPSSGRRSGWKTPTPSSAPVRTDTCANSTTQTIPQSVVDLFKDVISIVDLSQVLAKQKLFVVQCTHSHTHTHTSARTNMRTNK